MLAADLNVDARVFLEIAIPKRVVITPAERCGQHDAVTVAQIKRRRRAGLSGLASGRCQ
ncbi:MAG: hypothetical protein NVS4B6_14470 [Mycobacterium sp.]